MMMMMAMTTTEEFDDDALGKHLPTGMVDFERWPIDRLKTSTTLNDTDSGMTEWTHLLTTEESFPPHLEENLVPEQLARNNNHSDRDISTTPTETSPTTITTSVPVQRSNRKWKTKRTCAQQENFSGFANTLKDEAATCIEQGIQSQMLSQAPTMYSLLRVWVLRENNNCPHSYYCLPKRKSLLHHAVRVRGSKQWNGSLTTETNGGLNNTIAAVNFPPIDILNWLKIRHLVGESSPYPKYTLKRLHNNRKRKKWLKKALHRRRAEQARKSLAVKGIIL
jgi:hypothetical protein